jgi:hypothetical protein
MAQLADLHRAVQATLASKRLGQAVFVRYTIQGLDKAEAILPRLAHAAGTVKDWFGQPLTRIYAIGSVASGQVALTLSFRDGATALVSFAQGQPRGDGVDLMVLGNHGAIYHDAGSANLWDEPATTSDKPDPVIMGAIERALHSGKPEVVGSSYPSR